MTSVVTTTGFALGDYSLWGNFSLMLFFYLGFVGGCSGSTAGGIKIFRFQVAYILLKASLNQLIHPRAVIKQKYNGHRLDAGGARSLSHRNACGGRFKNHHCTIRLLNSKSSTIGLPSSASITCCTCFNASWRSFSLASTLLKLSTDCCENSATS